MKLVTFTQDDSFVRHVGVINETGGIVDLTHAEIADKGHSRTFSDMLALIGGEDEALEGAARYLEEASFVYRCDDCRLLAPLPEPPQIRDFMCFEKHVEQSIRSIARLRAMEADIAPEEAIKQAEAAGVLDIPKIWYDQPCYYKANRFAMSGDGDAINWPAYSTIKDYECEIACVIGKPGANIAKEDAPVHIFGYTIFNDFSARDAQSKEMQGMLGPAKGKDFDGANAMGPCLITADEFNPADDHAMIVRVNGAERSRGTTKDMHWTFADLIAYVSQEETLHAGEILGSGTVGNGCGLELMQFLDFDDEIELEIEGIGMLTNTIRKPSHEQ